MSAIRDPAVPVKVQLHHDLAGKPVALGFFDPPPQGGRQRRRQTPRDLQGIL